jgi:hypothetical protein
MDATGSVIATAAPVVPNTIQSPEIENWGPR